MIKEKDLVHNINSYLFNNEYLYGNEIRMGNGIPDIMIGLALNPEITYFENYYHVRFIDDILKNGITNVDDLINGVNLPQNKVKQILSELSNLRAIDIKENKIILNENLKIEEKGINISIEVKIKDWKNGLLQAQRYLNFSDYSYLAIKYDYVKNIDIVLSQELGIGIISFIDEELVEILKPKKSQSCNYLFKNVSLSQLKKQKMNYSVNCTFLSIS